MLNSVEVSLVMKKLFSFRLSEELMDDVREIANAEGISVTKLVENVLEKHVRPESSSCEISDSSARQTVEPRLNQSRGVDANLLRDLLLEILFDRGTQPRASQQQTHGSQELKELKEQVKSLESMVRAVLKEKQDDATPLSDYTKCNT